MAKRFSIQQNTEGVEIWYMEQLLSENTESSSTGTHEAPDTGLVLLLLYPELRAAPVEHYGE